MKWVKCSERLPELTKTVLIEYFSGDYERRKFMGEDNWWSQNVNAWLDESEVSFTVDDMKASWIECDKLHAERSDHGLPDHFFDKFIKENYNIDINK